MSVPPVLHELEGQIMAEVWRRDRCTVRDVLEALNSRNAQERAYTTIMTVMQRLDAKGLLERQRDGRHDVYVPLLSRDEYVHARAEAEVTAVIDEYGDVALAHFARHLRRLDPTRREQIRRLARGT